MLIEFARIVSIAVPAFLILGKLVPTLPIALSLGIWAIGIVVSHGIATRHSVLDFSVYRDFDIAIFVLFWWAILIAGFFPLWTEEFMKEKLGA